MRVTHDPPDASAARPTRAISGQPAALPGGTRLAHLPLAVLAETHITLNFMRSISDQVMR